jgi:hypothetical protein
VVRLSLRLLLTAALLCSGLPSQAERTQARILVQSSLAAGLRHHEAKAVWNRLRVGDALVLVREAGNPHDPNAVRLEWQGRVLGYLPREDNGDVARQLDRGAGLQARIAELTRHRNHRLKLGVEIYRDL